jgi:hypothetical protein
MSVLLTSDDELLPLALDREARRNHPRLAPITPTVPNSEPTVKLNSYVPHPSYHSEPKQPTHLPADRDLD